MNSHFSIVWGTRQITFNQLQLYMASSFKQLKGMGVKPGDRVGICEENSVEYIVLLLTLWQMKAVAAPISPRWPAKMVAAYVSRINAVHLFKGTDVRRIVCFDARNEITADQACDFNLDDDVSVIATSGSSGEPKAAVHTWGNHFYSAKGSNEIIPLTPQDRWALSLGFYHVAGIGVLVRCLLSGAAVVVVGEGDLAAAMARSKVTHVSLVPTQLYRLLADEKNHALLKSLKCILLGGSAIPNSLVEQALSLGLNIYLSYGSTEMASQIATGKPLGVGKPSVKVLPYRELMIAPDGEILVRGKTLFKGYIVGEKLQLPLTGQGWFKTGDMGRLDGQDCLTVGGRRDNMFISGGENIQPEEIEKALLSIAGVLEAMVVPKEDKEFGHRPVAFIKFNASSLNAEKIVQCLKADLPHFKIPTAFYPWPQDLISGGIKISRQDMLKRI